MKSFLAAVFAFCLFASPSFAAEKPKALKVLLISGGCCHDYEKQAKLFQDGAAKLVNIEWTIMIDPRRGTEGEIELYNDPEWSKGYDVVIHNECFANTKNEEYIKKITEVHKKGTPAVVSHCAMHTYRAAKFDDWREFLGVTSFQHEHQSEYPVTVVEKDHPVMKHFPKEWKTPKDELYVIQKVWPNTTVLATSKSERNGKEHGNIWVNQYGKARVFGTTWGHGNATWEDAVFIDTITRGMVWAAGKLDDDGNVAKEYQPLKAAE